MVVIHAAKRPFHLRIAEMPRWIERRDADSQTLPNEKMRCFPSYFLTEPEQAATDACYYFFFSLRCRAHLLRELSDHL